MAIWPFRRRKRDEDYVGRHRPGAWADIALPPAIEGNRVDTVIESVPETVTIAPAPAVVAAPPQPEPAVPAVVDEPKPVVSPPQPVASEPVPVMAHAAPAPTVRLGFTDGTSMELASGSGDSEALQRAAMRLLGEG